jgi:hypothetical protein
MSSEYDTLYSFLEKLIVNKTTTEEPSVLSAIIPDHIEATPKKRGRPPGSKTKKMRCAACMDKFQIDELIVHQESSVACKKFLAMKEKPPIVAYPIHQLIINALEEVTTDHDRCRFCESVIADMKVHMTESQACNRMAYIEFKKVF